MCYKEIYYINTVVVLLSNFSKRKFFWQFPWLLAFPISLSVPKEWLHVSHSLPWLLAVSHCLYHCHGITTCLLMSPLLLAVSHSLFCPMELIHVSHGLLWLLAVSNCLFGSMYMLHVSIFLQCLLPVSYFLYSPIDLIHVSHCFTVSLSFLAVSYCLSGPIELLYVSQCLSLLLAASHSLCQCYGVAECLSLSPMVSCCFLISILSYGVDACL